MRSRVPRVELTKHLSLHFPQLDGSPIELEAGTVAEVVEKLEARIPGLGFYICDERGRLRQHVNIFIGEELISDRNELSDPVEEDSRVLIMQALSGG